MHVAERCSSNVDLVLQLQQHACGRRREFADYVSVVADPAHARVVAVTSAERAEAALKERPDFFDEVTKIL